MPNMYAYVDDLNLLIDPLGLSGLECSKAGKATIKQFHGEGRAGHFSIEIEYNGKKTYTHQVITASDRSTTRIVDANIYSPSGKLANSKTIDLLDAEAAVKKQEELMDINNLGRYEETTNSCLTHVADILEAGGNSPVPRSERGLFVFAKRLGFSGL